MRAFLLFAAALLLCAQEEPVFRGGVSYVRIDAQVVDGKKVISTLGRDDFRIFDEGIEQTIEYFGHDAEPVHVLLLLDVSGSMRKRLAEMASVAQDALSALGPEDEVAVMFFGRNTLVAQEFTKSMDDAAAVIGTARRQQPVGSGTAINSSILAAAKYVKEQAGAKPGRRSIVILTDNSGLNYQVPDESVLEELSAADTVLNAIVTPNAEPPKPVKGNAALNPDFTPPDVFKLARETAGEVLKAEKAGETFREMMEHVRVRYSLHYRAPEGRPGQVRQVRVELSEAARKKYPHAEVRARSAYRIPE